MKLFFMESCTSQSARSTNTLAYDYCQIPPLTQFFVHINYTSNTAVCYADDVSDVVAPRVFQAVARLMKVGRIQVVNTSPQRWKFEELTLLLLLAVRRT